MNPLNYLSKGMEGHSSSYKRLVVSSYVKVLPLMLTTASPHLIKGLYYSFRKKEEDKYHEFLKGAKCWGKMIMNSTKTRLELENIDKIPDKGHFIFLNHINELDFPFDSYVLEKPYLANQHIKNTYFAYWWMKSMGSQVFDSTRKRTIAMSVRNLVAGLKTTSYIVYPEGHNSYTEEIKPLKKGMIKLAYDMKVPIYLLIKSGVTQFQQKSKGNTLAYKGLGIIQPQNYGSWEELQAEILRLMQENKKALDEKLGLKAKEPAV